MKKIFRKIGNVFNVVTLIKFIKLITLKCVTFFQAFKIKNILKFIQNSIRQLADKIRNFILHPKQIFQALLLEAKPPIGGLASRVRSCFLFFFKHPKQTTKLCFKKLNRFAKWCWATMPRRIVSSILIALFIITPIFNILFVPKTQAAWWNDSWLYRKSIAVTNSSGSTLTDFQIKILDNKDLSSDITAGKIQATLNDLRFTDLNGDLLPYWIEDSTATSVDVWIKMKTIPTSGSSVYMYYGNSGATSMSDGNKTFKFFDDFNDGDVSNWSKESSTISAQSVDGNQGLNITPGGSQYKDTEVYKNIILPVSYTVESKIKDIGAGAYPGGLIITYQDVNNWIALEGSATQWTERGENGGGDTNWVHNYSPNIIPTGWQKQRIDIPNDGNYKVWVNDVLQATNALPYSFTRNGIGFAKHVGYGDIFADWIFVRKYASTSPTASAPASEEKGPGPVAYWKLDEGTGTAARDSVTSKGYVANATGGTITESGGYRYHTFTSGNGTFVPITNGQVEVYTWGGGGAGGTVGGWIYGAAGGAGAAARGVLNVSNGTSYAIVVGGGGGVNSYNGGSITCANGGGGCASWNNSDNRYGSGGGGYSGIFNTSVSQANALLIAAGGGGGGSSRAGTGNAGGAGGGAFGQDGYSPYDSKTAYAGKGGTQTAAGVDASCDSQNTTGGQGALQGGRAKVNSYGGAGGGGYWGGSGGGYSEANTMGGGGGGSSYYNSTLVLS